MPIMIDRTPWPPPGPLALLLSQLVYIDLAGQHSLKDNQNSLFQITVQDFFGGLYYNINPALMQKVLSPIGYIDFLSLILRFRRSRGLWQEQRLVGKNVRDRSEGSLVHQVCKEPFINDAKNNWLFKTYRL